LPFVYFGFRTRGDNDCRTKFVFNTVRLLSFVGIAGSNFVDTSYLQVVKPIILSRKFYFHCVYIRRNFNIIPQGM